MITTAGVRWPDTLTPAGTVACACSYEKNPDPSHLPLLPEQLLSAVPKRQAEFLAGRVCAASALDRLGWPKTAIPIGEGRAPVWPDGIAGSITHVIGFAAAIVSADSACRGLGIDVERVMDDAHARPLMRQVATDREWALLADRFAAGRGFAILFSAKEALYKAIYPSLQQFVGFTEATCIGLDDRTLQFTLTSDIRDRLRKADAISVRYLLEEQHVHTLCHLT